MQKNTQVTAPTMLRTRPGMLAWFCMLAVAMLLLLAACGSSTGGGGTTSNPAPTTAPTATAAPSPTATSGNTMMVTVINGSSGFAFSPASLTVTVGTTVTWQNSTSAPHTVTSDTGNTLNGMLSTGGTYSFTFTTPGTYSYHCSIHPYMKATIIVH